MAKTITGKVVRVERMGLSYYGNPYHRVTIETPNKDFEVYRTKINAGINYAIENKEYKEKDHTFKLTNAGRIYAVEK